MNISQDASTILTITSCVVECDILLLNLLIFFDPLGKMNGVVCVTLLLLTFSSLVTCQAPGDSSGDCTPDSVSTRTRVQLDSYNYMTLLPSPWSQISVDGDNNTVRNNDNLIYFVIGTAMALRLP